MTVPALPAQGSQSSYAWLQGVHTAVTTAVRVADPTGVAATDTARIQAALNEVGAAGGGVVQLGRGSYSITPDTLSIAHDGVTLRGLGGRVTRLVKASAGRLLDVSGTGEADAQMRHRCRLTDLVLDGAGLTGDLVRSYYSQFIICTRVLFENNNGSGFNAVQCWDSLFTRCRWDYVHGNSNGGNGLGAAVWLKCSDQGATTGQFGYSYSDCDNVNFDHCTWEQNMGRDVWMDGRKSDGSVGAERINECTFSGRTKMENATDLKAAPFIEMYHVADIDFTTLQISNRKAQTAPVDMVKMSDAIDVNLGRYRPEAINTDASGIRTALTVGTGVNFLRGEVLGSAQVTNKPTVALVEYTGTGRANNTLTAAYSYNPGAAVVTTGTPNA